MPLLRPALPHNQELPRAAKRAVLSVRLGSLVSHPSIPSASPAPHHPPAGRVAEWRNHRLGHPLHPSGNHSETLCLNVIPSPQTPIVLGLPWLQYHNPHLSWDSGRVVEWSPHCLANCLRSARPPGGPSPVPPSEYLDLGEVFLQVLCPVPLSTQALRLCHLPAAWCHPSNQPLV